MFSDPNTLRINSEQVLDCHGFHNQSCVHLYTFMLHNYGNELHHSRIFKAKEAVPEVRDGLFKIGSIIVIW